MKYYDICVKAGSLKSKNLAMTVVDKAKVFGKHVYFSLEKWSPQEPVKIQAHYYKGEAETIEDDLVAAGNPQIVSEEFKKLVEDLDSDAAQFFETESINCRTKKKYYVMHVTKAVNCLDESRSKFVYFPPPSVLGRSITVGMVDTSKIGENDHIFRMGENVQEHYVSEKFYKEWKKRKLTGCLFNLRS